MVNTHQRLNFTYILLLGSGLIFLAAAIFYNISLLSLLDTRPPVYKVSDKIRATQLDFLFIGLGLVLSAELGRQLPRLAGWMQKPGVTNILLSLLTLAMPLIFLELALKPFASREAATIFLRDDELGWRLRPNAKGTWGGVAVEINGKGLRGPELPYAKPAGVYRILYLGDSVTFGFMLAQDEETFPYQVEAILEEQPKREIETINAGVGGYSPWQEYGYLLREGLKYDPDLVVVSFVLNDVTEKFELLRYGGSWEGYQVAHTVFSEFDWWASKSSLLYFTKQIGGRLRFGRDVRRGAIVQEKLEVEMLAREPHHPDVQTAWQITLDNMGKIFALARAHNIPILLVVFPFTFQFDDPEALSTPQTVLSQYAQEQDVLLLDLLPLLAEKMAADGLWPAAYFLDEDHLSSLGSEVVAGIVADFVRLEYGGLLEGGGGSLE
jgi:lysophospholipase L1-like esterase